MEIISNVLPFLVFLALLWFTYTNVSFIVTAFRARKSDSTLKLCLSNVGKYFYIALTVCYVAILIVCIVFMVLALLNNKITDLYTPLNVVTITTMLTVYLYQQIIMVGHRQMMIGKIKLDYRKIKRVTYPKSKKLRFVYGQRTYETSLRFIDDFQLKKALQKAR